MKKILLISLVIASCKSAPDGFCECMEKGIELNEQTQVVQEEIIVEGDAPKAAIKKMLKLRKEKKNLCAEFENSSGVAMREWQEACD